MSIWLTWLPEFLVGPYRTEEPPLHLPDTASIAALADSELSESDRVSEAELRPVPKAKAFPGPPSPRVQPSWDINRRPRGVTQLPVVEFGLDFQSDILRTTHPDQLTELFPIFLEGLTRDPTLQSPHPQWTSAARLGRALRAGISAARVVAGRFHKQARSPPIPFPNEIYICLQCRDYPRGFWTWHYLVFIEIVGDAELGFQRGSVSHAFPTLVEGEVFLRGAGRQWPVEVQDLDH